MDFDAVEDQLLVQYSETDAAPDVSVEMADGNSMVLIDGVIVATLPGNTTLTLSQVSLVGA